MITFEIKIEQSVESSRERNNSRLGEPGASHRNMKRQFNAVVLEE